MNYLNRLLLFLLDCKILLICFRVLNLHELCEGCVTCGGLRGFDGLFILGWELRRMLDFCGMPRIDCLLVSRFR